MPTDPDFGTFMLQSHISNSKKINDPATDNDRSQPIAWADFDKLYTDVKPIKLPFQQMQIKRLNNANRPSLPNIYIAGSHFKLEKNQWSGHLQWPVTADCLSRFQQAIYRRKAHKIAFPTNAN